MNRSTIRRSLPLLLVALGVLSGCVEDERVIPPPTSDKQILLRRYVAMGNSITAGYQSGGINVQTQKESYPVLFAQHAVIGFTVPELAMPGCAPPLVSALDTSATGEITLQTERVMGGTSTTCAGRVTPVPDVLQNVAVPGATIEDAVSNTREGNGSNPLTTLILGGQTQVQAMQRAQPSFVSAWLGNNDVLGGALSGDLSRMTPLDTFTYYAGRLEAGIAGSTTIDALLIGVIDPTKYVPVLQPGLYFWTLDSLGISPKPVAANCAPTDGAGIENRLSMNLVSIYALGDPNVPAISCADDAPYLLNADEADSVSARVAAFNAVLSGIAADRDWLYVDANETVRLQLLGTAAPSRLRLCDGLDNGDDLADIVDTVVKQCPWPSAPNFFGTYVTFDGIHPSKEAHQVIADAMSSKLEAKYQLGL